MNLLSLRIKDPLHCVFALVSVWRTRGSNRKYISTANTAAASPISLKTHNSKYRNPAKEKIKTYE